MLLDLQMPIKNGLEVMQETRMHYERARLSYPNLKLEEPEYIFMTAFANKNLKAHMERKGVKYCFEKPIAVEVLAKILN